MSFFFVDTSALIKRYLHEPGSEWVRSWIGPSTGHFIIISDIAVVELSSVLARQRRARMLSVAASVRLRNAFLGQLQQDYVLITVDSMVYDAARDLAFTHSLKALDALQLASAKRAQDVLQQSIIFVSGDVELLAAAAAEGFAVENPLHHP